MFACCLQHERRHRRIRDRQHETADRGGGAGAREREREGGRDGEKGGEDDSYTRLIFSSRVSLDTRSTTRSETASEVSQNGRFLAAEPASHVRGSTVWLLGHGQLSQGQGSGDGGGGHLLRAVHEKVAKNGYNTRKRVGRGRRDADVSILWFVAEHMHLWHIP